jgi:F0F1-type ATP synthase membrane subunit b/b'
VSTKQWFIAYFAVYLVVGITIIQTVGPRGFTEEYIAQYGHEHEHYLEIIKSDEYELWSQRPNLYPMSAELQGKIDFVERYEGREAFQTEQARRGRFDMLFDFFNVIMVAYLMVHFARRPLMGFLDGQIQETRERVQLAEQAHAESLQLRTETEARISGLSAETVELAKHNSVLMEEERRKFEDFTRLGLHEIDQEAAQRRNAEVLAAKHRIREELIAQAVEKLTARYKVEASPERVTKLTAEFVRQLEKRA